MINIDISEIYNQLLSMFPEWEGGPAFIELEEVSRTPHMDGGQIVTFKATYNGLTKKEHVTLK